MDTEQWCKNRQIRISSERVDGNPNVPDWKDADHHKVTLRHDGRQLTIYFSKGYGHKGAPPTAAEVLDCLASDANSVEMAHSFEDWAAELGYDPDSRKAEHTYKLCLSQAQKLRRFLGDDLAYDLLYNTERL